MEKFKFIYQIVHNMILRVWHDYENEAFSLIPIFDKPA